MTLNRSIWIATLLASFAGATAAYAAPVITTITDQVWIDPFRTNCSGVNCDSTSYPNYTDSLGAYYDTTKIVVTKNDDKTMTIELTTKKAAFSKVSGTSGASQPRYDGSIPYADLGIAIRPDGYVSDASKAEAKDFDLAIELNTASTGSFDTSGNGITQHYTGSYYKNYSNYGQGYANIYENEPGVDNMWQSSQYAYDTVLDGSGVYGGRFRPSSCGPLDSDCVGQDHDVFVNVDYSEADAMTNKAQVKYTDGANDTTILITLSEAALKEMGLMTAAGYYNDFELFWGTAWCGNDAIWGVIVGDEPPPVDVPEPGTLAAFGVGLAGLVIARRRRKAA